MRLPCDQARVPGVEHPVPEPAEQHLEPMAEADQERDMDGAPQEPRQESADLEPADLRHSLGLADDSQRPLVAVDEWHPGGRAGSALDLTGDGAAGEVPHLDAALGDAG